MSLAEIVSRYVVYKQTTGMRFRTEHRILKSFSRSIGDIGIAEVQPDAVRAFLAGTGPITRNWQRKQEALTGFYRFAMTSGVILMFAGFRSR